MAEIKQNMLRERAKKLPEIADDQWALVNSEYRELMEEFISAQSLSPKSKIQYRSVLKQFGWFVYEKLKNKRLCEISKRDFIKYLSHLRDERKMSSSGQQTRKTIVSSFCNFIENIIAEDEPDYKNFKNFTRGLPAIPKNKVYDKVKITHEEYLQMMDVLEKDEDYLGMAWLATAFNVGARRSEIIQFKSEIANYDFGEGTFIMSHNIRLKGGGEDGKVEAYMINKEAIKYIKIWLEKRGYDHEYIFTTKYNKEISAMADSWADYFCKNKLSPILGRRINPHLFKASCVTHLLEQGIPIEMVSKFIAHHESVATTIAHYDLRDFEDQKNNIFK